MELFICKLKNSDILPINKYGCTPLFYLCENISITYEILELFIYYLTKEDLYFENSTYLLLIVNNKFITNKLNYYKLFIVKSLKKEEFIENIGTLEYNKYSSEIDEYFEIVNSDYDLK